MYFEHFIPDSTRKLCDILVVMPKTRVNSTNGFSKLSTGEFPVFTGPAELLHRNINEGFVGFHETFLRISISFQK
jgi:hypothetical protein